MNEPIRVALADDNENNRSHFIRMFREMGFDPVIADEDGSDFVLQCIGKSPDLVVTSVRMPDRNGVEATRQIDEKRPVAMVVLADSRQATCPKNNVEGEQIPAYFSEVPTSGELKAVVSVSLAIFSRFCQLDDKVSSLEQQLQEVRASLVNRKTVEQAKGIIMKWFGIDEAHAYRRLRKLARDKNYKLVDMANIIVDLDKKPNVSRRSVQ